MATGNPVLRGMMNAWALSNMMQQSAMNRFRLDQAKREAGFRDEDRALGEFQTRLAMLTDPRLAQLDPEQTERTVTAHVSPEIYGTRSGQRMGLGPGLDLTAPLDEARVLEHRGQRFAVRGEQELINRRLEEARAASRMKLGELAQTEAIKQAARREFVPELGEYVDRSVAGARLTHQRGEKDLELRAAEGEKNRASRKEIAGMREAGANRRILDVNARRSAEQARRGALEESRRRWQLRSEEIQLEKAEAPIHEDALRLGNILKKKDGQSFVDERGRKVEMTPELREAIEVELQSVLDQRNKILARKKEIQMLRSGQNPADPLNLLGK
ncbi:MAG: hypothetical protein ACK5AZ_24870 [Bryobacteraceae bacterium]